VIYKAGRKKKRGGGGTKNIERLKLPKIELSADKKVCVSVHKLR